MPSNNKLYQSVLSLKNDATNVYIPEKIQQVDRTFKGKQLQEVNVVAKKLYDYKGCVSGLCNDLSTSNKLNNDEFRKSNNLYGDAWKLLDNTYGTDIDISKNYSTLKVNDIVNLSRDRFDSDIKNGIPEKNQHVGRISKIVDGVPYVKHYISNIGKKTDGTPYGDYYEEPINNISRFVKYTPTRAKRLDQFKQINVSDKDLKYDLDYKPNDIELDILKADKNRNIIQNVLKLDSAEYKRLSNLSYGILGAESSFGRSKRTLYRMAVPNIIQKGVKLLDDKIRDKDIYDENINNLSRGYSSTKESTLHGINDNTGKLSYQDINKKVRAGDFTDLEKTNNYLQYAFNKLNLNENNLNSGENSYKATLANLAWYIKRNPNITDEQILSKYTGKSNLSKYKEIVESYNKNINGKQGDNKEYTTMQNILGKLSHTSNKIEDFNKKVNSEITSTIRDIIPLPINIKALAGSVVGAKKTITENTLSSSEYNALKEIVKNNISAGLNTIQYSDYGTSKNKNDDVGGENSPSVIKGLFNDNYKLKTFLGQAGIKKINDNEYEVVDTYDFNDKGKSFGIKDDIKKRGANPYNIFRAIGRNYGESNGQGTPVKIKIKL
jgi:hypothetical protein